MGTDTTPSSPEGFSFPVKNSSGVLVAADALPTCVVKRIYTSSGNRVIDESAAVPVVTAGPTTGLYFAKWTNGAWDVGDKLYLYATAVISGTSYTSLVEVFEVKNLSSGASVSLTLGAVVPLSLGVVTGLTEPIVIGDDYTADVGREIPIVLTDQNGDPIDVTYGSHTLAADCTIKALFHPEGPYNVNAFITGTCTFVPAVGLTPASLLVSLPKSETSKANPGQYQIQIDVVWGNGSTVTLAYTGIAIFARDIRRRS